MNKAKAENAIENEIRELEEGEAWEASDEPVHLEAKRPLDKVVPIRLSAEHWEDLRKIARELGVGPTTLARMWILERLRSERPASVGPESLTAVKEARVEYVPGRVGTHKELSGKRSKK